jgi:Bacterial SH3 domain
MCMLQRTRSAFYLVLGASFLLFLFMLRAPAWADGLGSATTNARLNLRSCPATQSCPVLLTLPRNTPLEVLGNQGDWTKVRVVASGEEGWVNSGYIILSPATERSGYPELYELLFAWKLPIFLTLLAGAILLLAFLMRRLSPNEFQGSPLLVILASLALGFTFLLNQFGPLFAKLTASYLDITALAPLWSVNSVCEQLAYPTVLLILSLLTLAIGAAAPARNECRGSFFQGVSAGFLLLPVSCLAGALAAAVIWLIGKIFLRLGYVLGIILIPIAWLFTNAILPVLRFLAIPLVWIWDSFLRDFLLLIATPFIWIKNVILAPLFAFLLKYLILPIFFLLVGVGVVMACLFPFAAVGGAILDSARSSFEAPLNSKGLFSQGMAMGFCLLDASLLIGLDHYGLLHSTPPLSLLVLLALPVIILLRLLVNREATLEPALERTFQGKFLVYCKSSKIGLISSCMILPALVFFNIVYQGDDGGGG